MNFNCIKIIDGKKPCSKCKQILPVKCFTGKKEAKCGLQPQCRECRAQEHISLRYEVLNHYSKGTPCCVCCGEDQYEFLSLDHIEGGGNQHRQEVPHVYRWLKRNEFPIGYQVLCHNCNLAKGFYGECPHQVKRRIQNVAA